MNYIRILLIIAMMTCRPVHSAIVVEGNSTTAPYAFTSDVTATTFDYSTGTFFVGLEEVPGLTGNRFSISKAPRPTFNATPKFSPVLLAEPASVLLNKTIEFLAFSPQQGTSILAAVAKASLSMPFAETEVTALFVNGKSEQTTAALDDAAGSTTAGIVNIAASSSHIFAAVRPSGSTFGEPNSGIALISIDTNGTSVITLNVKDATTGINGNKALELQKGSSVLTGGTSDVLFTTTSVAMYWDEPMQRLFIGVDIVSGSDVNDIAKSVVIARLVGGILTFQEIAPNGAISGGGIDEVVVTQGADQIVSAKHLRVMHTSTGPDYLIVDCMSAAAGSTCNRILALPLVNDTSNPSSSLNGTLASKNSALNATTNKFTVAATAAGQLAENNAITNPAAVVGAGNLPKQPDDAISDIVVIGDTVYVSIDTPPNGASNDSGIFYSQALFSRDVTNSQDGKILRWTPWTKRGVPLNAFPGITLPGGVTHDGSIQFFNVDATNGSIWIVEGTTLQTVGITAWTKGITPTDLISSVATALPEGSFAVLDLDQATRGFLSTTAHRYALFGGNEKIVFTRISVAANRTSLSSPQTSITDFSLSQNFLLTPLPEDAGCCQVLEYSRTSTTAGDANNLNYFFAGTQNGLYVFTDDSGNGFNALDLSTLEMPPFSTRSWKKIDTIAGSVVDIKTSGAGNLYVLTLETSLTNPFSSTLYSIPFASTTGTMFASGNIRTIAQTNVDVFKNIIQFSGIQIIATDNPTSSNPEAKEQLVLTTNQGLFTSNADQTIGDGIPSVTNQTDANWMLVASGDNTTKTTTFYGIAGIDTPVRYTTWPISIQDQLGFGTFDRSSIHQFSGNGNTTGSAPAFNAFFSPLTFNARPQTAPFNTLDPITYFFSDGARRFFIVNPTQMPPTENGISIIPYDITVWSVGQPTVLTNPVLDLINRFYWVKQIGASGILLVGTASGVVGLE